MCTQDAWEFPKQAPEVFYQKGGLEKLVKLKKKRNPGTGVFLWVLLNF